MNFFTKRKILKFLKTEENNPTTFNEFLNDYLSGNLKDQLSSLGLTRQEIHVDLYLDIKCIGVLAKKGKYYVDLQIYPDEFLLSVAQDESDDGSSFELTNKEDFYSLLSNKLNKFSD